MKSGSKPEIREWALRAIDAVDNEAVHSLWSKVAPGAINWHDMQYVKDRKARVTGDITGELADLVNSLRCVVSDA